MSAAYERLAADLRSAVRGEVRFDAGTKAMYSNTGSNYRQVPIGVVIPLDADDVVAAVAVCRAHEAPVLPRGGGTSLAGQSCNVAVIVDMSRNMRGLLELDPERERARVEPGIVLDALRDAAEEHGLTFAPDPSTHKACTLGGMIGNNSCGVHSLLGGKTVENVEALEILTYDGLRMTVGATSEDELGRIVVAGGRRGEIYGALRDLRDEVGHLVRERYPRIPRRVSGYNLDELLEERGFDLAKALVGTEGTCVTVLEATLRLVPSPPCRELVAIGFDDVYAAADAVPAVLEHGPIGLEGIDDVLIDDMKRVGIHPSEVQLLPDGRGWLLAEFGADTIEEAESKCEELVKALRGTQGFVKEKHFEDQDEVAKLWEVREWARATAHVPHAPGTRGLAKAAAGVAPERELPRFAARTFRAGFVPLPGSGPPVLLWPDTFNDNFHPETLAAGYSVQIPRTRLCCGRPLYDYGMLDLARRQLRQIVSALRAQIRAGMPLVGLEPSCVAVFRDELLELLPHDEDAKRLAKQSFVLSELLERTDGWDPGRLPKRALVHGHCHQKALMGMSAEETVLKQLDVEYELLDAGCCGMAGAFGFEREHYAISIACGERALLPAVRAADADTVVVANGFSCREQIAQTTDRKAVHLAELIRMGVGNA